MHSKSCNIRFDAHDVHRASGAYEYEYESGSESGETDSDLDSEDESHAIAAPYRSADYENFFHLVTHTDQATEADTIAFSTSACLLLYYLKSSGYFGSSGSRCDIVKDESA